MLSKDECCKDEFKKLLKINIEFCFAVLSTEPRASRMLDKCPILNYILKYSELYFSPFYDSDITNFFYLKVWLPVSKTVQTMGTFRLSWNS